MNERYEFIEYLEGLPIRLYLHSVRSFPFHWHKELEILMSVKGSFYVEYRGKMVRVKEGDLVVIGPNIIHATGQTEEPNQVIGLQINCEEISVQKAYEACFSKDFECVGNPGDNPAIDMIRRSLCSIVLEVYYKHTGYLYTVSAHAQIILGTLLSHFTREPEPDKTDMKNSFHERILRILNYINENFAQRITLQDLASKEFVSTNYLSSYIKKNLGMTLSDYLNSIRLRKYHEYLQTDFLTPINDIAYKCGFSSPQYAAALFSRQYSITPGKFRREVQKQSMIMKGAIESLKHGNYIDAFPELDVSLIMKYLQTQTQPELPETVRECFLAEVDCDQPTDARYFGSAVRVTTIGRAYEGLLSHVQRQLIELQEEIGFSYVRFHGLMSDDMMIIRADTSGAIQYNFFLVDQLMDFLLSIRLKPFLELTFMPGILASGKQTVFSWKANITPPASLGQWRDLVRALMSHLVSRYGAEEVCQWYFEVWNEPDLTDISWTGTQQEFFRFYMETAKTIESVLPSARILGPSITSVGLKSKKWVRAFMKYCESHQVPVHAFSLHLYSEVIREDNLAFNLRRVVKSTSLLQQSHPLMERNYVKILLDNLRGQLGKKYQNLPIIATEWNLSLSMYNPINDSAFAGTSLIHESLINDSNRLLLLHWTGLDYMEEAIPLPVQEFHGGFGLLTVNGLRKPAYWAMWALSKLGHEVLEKKDYGILTRKGDELVLLIYHHPFTEFAYDISYAKPFSISSSQMMEINEYQWRLTIQATNLKVRRFRFMLDRSDSRKVMADLNIREPLDAESIRQIKQRVRPEYSEENVNCNSGQYSIRCMLRKCEFELITISRSMN